MDSVQQALQNVKLPKALEDLKYPAFDPNGVATKSAAALLALYMANKVYGTDPIGRTLKLFSYFAGQEKERQIKVENMIDQYNDLHDGKLDDRNSNYNTLVNAYYELATSFYEWGWSQSFHFAYKMPGETFLSSLARHEYHIASKLALKAGDKVLDCGCGVGGPMRNIAKFTRANITGVTLSEHQVIRGNTLNAAAGLSDLAKSVQADFMKLPFEDCSYDGCYAIEATCHAPKREGVYGEIFRVLKPGKYFACYEWCLTPKYDPENESHRLIKKKIEEGDGLPDMATQEECVEALKSVGFEIIEYRDVALDNTLGGEEWYMPLYPSWNPLSFRFQLNPLGMWLTTFALKVAESVWLVPSGTSKIQTMLQQGGWGCVQGGVHGVFTPMFLMVARKPMN